MNNKNNEPLMFINTIQEYNLNKHNNQEYYDSRGKRNIQQIESKYYLFKEKLENAIKLYNKNTPVLCKFITNKESVEGIPIMLNDKIVVIKVNDKEKELYLNQINELMIISF